MTHSRTPLVLLPGSLCDARLFGPLIRVLQRRPVRVGNIGGAASIATIAQAVLRNAPPRFALAGLSMGGIVAFEIWRQAPQRVAGLALLDTSCAAETPEVRFRRSEEMLRVGTSGTAGLRRLIREFYAPKYFAHRNRHDEQLRDAVVQMATACGPAVLSRQWTALMHRPDSRATLATIDCPALVLCGAEDQLCAPAMHEVMAATLAVQCHVLGNCGHFPCLEAPRETAELMQAWLRGVDAREYGVWQEQHDVAC